MDDMRGSHGNTVMLFAAIASWKVSCKQGNEVYVPVLCGKLSPA